MGHEQSNLCGLQLDEKAVDITEFWTQHSAKINGGNLVSVFVGEPLVGGSLWKSKTPLEKVAKNLMVYRHPFILKYISSWNKGSKFYLALEDVKPLSLVLANQNTLQICVGLHSILKALCFLHDTAFASHNNVCVSSIYVTNDGDWRLSGMEYLCRYIDLTEDYLRKTRAHRYKNGVDQNEDKNIKTKSERPYVIDCYAYGVLVNEILEKKSGDDIPYLSSFRDFCKEELQNSDEALRPKLSSLLDHKFFTHDFITVYSYLSELPLKLDESKVEFFTTLSNKLKAFNENVVASQLGGLLLSRMVLLDKTAQRELLPCILCPRLDESSDKCELFSVGCFKTYLVPRLLQIFCVRDAQIRLLLLKYLEHYLQCFTADELESQILPELLVGIKDTNDNLVSVTLRALADIVPILGATTVIGGKRAKLFNDGRPIIHPIRNLRGNPRRASDSTRTNTLKSISEPNLNNISMLELPERPSPDGEEGESTEIEQSAEDDLENWEDWDMNEGNTFPSTTTTSVENSSTNIQDDIIDLESNFNSSVTLTNKETTEETPVTNSVSESKLAYEKKKVLPDILELDIKNQIDPSVKNEEFDFFQDMEPVIQSSAKYILPLDEFENNIRNEDDEIVHSKKLGVIEIEKHEEGWSDEFDWE